MKMLYLDAFGEVKEVFAPFLRTPGNYDTDEASEASGLRCEDPSRTQQQFKKECDINEIVRRFGLTGEFPENFNPPTSVDFTDTVTDFHTAANLMVQANQEFNSLPAALRKRFYNDPQELMTFLENGENEAEARSLGLLKDPVTPPAPLQVEVVNPVADTPPSE